VVLAFIKEWLSNYNIFKFLYVSRRSTARILKAGEKRCVYFADNSLLFPIVKEFSKSVNSWWNYCKKFDTTLYFMTYFRRLCFTTVSGVL